MEKITIERDRNWGTIQIQYDDQLIRAGLELER
jgi:hypothetical protein